MLYSPWTNLKPKIIHVSHSVFSVTTYKSASLIRSRTTGDTCIHFANKSSPTTAHPPTSLIWCLHSCTAPWTLGGNGNSSTSTSRRTDSTGESSPLPPFPLHAAFIPPKVWFARERGNRCSCSARLSRRYWWLETRRVSGWWCFWNSAHFPPLDAVSQRLIFSVGIHFASSVWQHVTFTPRTTSAHVQAHK